MLKTISAALLAVSVLAAPAMAAGVAKTAPVTKSETTKVASVETSKPPPASKAVRAKPSVMNANARMGRHHYRHSHFHRHASATKAHQFSKVTLKHNRSAVKRG